MGNLITNGLDWPASSACTARSTRCRHTHSIAPRTRETAEPGARDNGTIAQISGWNWLKRELDRTTGVTAWRLHDFRRSIVTNCAKHGAEVAVLDTMLNHASSATRSGVIGTYQRATLLEPMRKVMALWDRLLSEELQIEALSQAPPAVGQAGDQTIVDLAAHRGR
jgi:hypothetical protein